MIIVIMLVLLLLCCITICVSIIVTMYDINIVLQHYVCITCIVYYVIT